MNCIPHSAVGCYRWLTCYVCSWLCQCFGQGGCYFRCDKPCACSYTGTQRFLLLRSCAFLNCLGKLGFQAQIGLQKEMSGSSLVWACDFGLGLGSGFKMKPFYKSVWVCRQRQQWEIERIHPPPTKSKNILKSLFEVGYANFRPNVFGAGKRISMEILVGVGLHAWCPVALKRFVAFSKNGNVQENIYRLCNATWTRHQIAQ